VPKNFKLVIYKVFAVVAPESTVPQRLIINLKYL